MNNVVILFVDDESSVLNSLRRELHNWAKLKSVTILTALSAREGFTLLEQQHGEIAVIVSDMKMPEMGGSDFLLAVKKQYPDIVTIILSGYSEGDDMMKAIKAGVSSFILKPWEEDYLKSELDKALFLYKILKERADYLKTVSAELLLAGELQRIILLPRIRETEGINFMVSYRPIPQLGCGGDYYDIIDLGGTDRYLCLIGDVAGHGIRAAIVTGILKAVIYPEYVSGVISKAISPAHFLGWLNGRMEFELKGAAGLVISFLAVVIDRGKMSLTYANAGQTRPYIVREGAAHELPVSGPCIGFTHNPEYTEKAVALRKDDLFFAFSDGLVEVSKADGIKAEEKLKHYLGTTAYDSNFHQRIMEAVLADTGSGEFRDDVAILSAKLT